MIDSVYDIVIKSEEWRTENHWQTHANNILQRVKVNSTRLMIDTVFLWAITNWHVN